MADTSNVTLTPDQYRIFAQADDGALPAGMQGANGWSIPTSDYNNAYNQFTSSNPGVGASVLQGFPTPSTDGGASAASSSAAAPAAFATPTYAQFLASQANRGPVIYSGGSIPGMSASDAQNLQSFYSPKKAVGGFVPPTGFGSQPQAFADGGMPSSAEMSSWVTRREATDSVPHGAGLFNSPVPGRTDKLDSIVPGGAYVIPADVVSGLGQGNTMAGSGMLDRMFHTNPYAIQGNSLARGMGLPHPPGLPRQTPPLPTADRAKGGATPTRIIAAGGEYLVPPEAVTRLGGGDIKKGHAILDHFVRHARKKIVKETSKLPGPK